MIVHFVDIGAIVHFVDIGVIVSHHSLNFLSMV